MESKLATPSPNPLFKLSISNRFELPATHLILILGHNHAIVGR
jgi:hypothetical protein